MWQALFQTSVFSRPLSPPIRPLAERFSSHGRQTRWRQTHDVQSFVVVFVLVNSEGMNVNDQWLVMDQSIMSRLTVFPSVCAGEASRNE
jgi:hypothetical protein